MRLTLPRRLGTPLLAKDLVEMANRRRTYVLRMLYGLGLFGTFLVMLYAMLEQASGNPFNMLGRGQEMFQVFVVLQVAGIYLFLPAMVSGCITQEKESESLQLLLITDLRPTEILLAKLVSRMVPMLSFLLMALPLLAIIYAFGGVTTPMLAGVALVLLAAILQVGCLALLMSAWCRSTVAAFLGTYGAGLVLYFGPPLCLGVYQMLVAPMGYYYNDEVAWGLFPVYVLFEHAMNTWSGPVSIVDTLLALTPILVSAAVFFLLARLVFVRRALLPPKNALRQLFVFFDAVFNRMNTVTGGVVLVKDRPDHLPRERPVTWLEVRQRALGKFRYLLRLFLVLEIPVFVVSALMLTELGYSRGESEGAAALLFMMWPVVGLIIVVQAAGAFAGERRRQTLGVLLTTPLSGAQIVRQKMAALWRLILVMALPLLSVVCVEAWYEAGDWGSRARYDNTGLLFSTLGRSGFYVLASVLWVAVYLPMVAWLGVLVGMVVRHPTRAMLAAVGALVVWCGLAPVAMGAYGSIAYRYVDDETVFRGMLLSPATIIPVTEFNMWREYGMTADAVALVNVALYGGVTLLLRTLCLRCADRWLGRQTG